jgi:hypothetical protein
MTAAQRATLEKLMIDVDNWTDEESARQVDALRAALGTCGTCAHAGEQFAGGARVWCAAPNDPTIYPFVHKAMPLSERCNGWTAKEGA